MMKFMGQFMAILVLSLTTQTSFAQANSAKNKIKNLVESYESKLDGGNLTQEEALAAQESINQIVVGSSKSDLESVLEDMVSEIPDVSQRDILLKKIKFSTKEELTSMLVDPKILETSLRGEGANFNFSQNGDLLSSLALVLLVGFIIYAVVVSLTHEYWYSYSYSGSMYSGDTCTSSDFNLSSSEVAAMKADAMAKCKAGAKNPDTCDARGLKTSTDYDTDYYGNVINGYCDISYLVMSEK